MLWEFTVSQAQDIKSCMTVALPVCYSSLLAVLPWCLPAPDLDQVPWCKLLNWHRPKWWCLYIPSIVKSQILPEDSAFTSPFLRQTKQPPNPGTRVISQLQQTRSMSSAVKKTEKDPEIRYFSASVQPQELVFWEFRYPPLPPRYYPAILDAKTFILFSSIPVCEGVILYQVSLKNIPTSVQQTREINYFGDMGENKKK